MVSVQPWGPLRQKFNLERIRVKKIISKHLSPDVAVWMAAYGEKIITSSIAEGVKMHPSGLSQASRRCAVCRQLRGPPARRCCEVL